MESKIYNKIFYKEKVSQKTLSESKFGYGFLLALILSYTS